MLQPQVQRRKIWCCSQELVAMLEGKENVEEGRRGAAEQASLIELLEDVKSEVKS